MKWMGSNVSSMWYVLTCKWEWKYSVSTLAPQSYETEECRHFLLWEERETINITMHLNSSHLTQTSREMSSYLSCPRINLIYIKWVSKPTPPLNTLYKKWGDSLCCLFKFQQWFCLVQDPRTQQSNLPKSKTTSPVSSHIIFIFFLICSVTYQGFI